MFFRSLDPLVPLPTVFGRDRAIRFNRVLRNPSGLVPDPSLAPA